MAKLFLKFYLSGEISPNLVTLLAKDREPSSRCYKQVFALKQSTLID